MFDREKLIALFHSSGALRTGEFVLASGKTSNYFLDGKLVSLDSAGLRLICEGVFDLVADIDFDTVGGMSMGADPMVCGMLVIAAERGIQLDGWLVRKEAKGRGTNKYVEGPVQPGANVVVIDDVVTTGGSALLSAERIRDVGGNIVQVVGIVDRLEGGAENFAAAGFPFRSLLTVRDLGITPQA